MIQLPQGPLDLTQVKALLDALPVPIWLKDAQSVLLAANAAAMRVSPLPEAQLLGTRGELFFEPEHLARTLAYDQETWEAAKVTLRDEELWGPQHKGQRWWRTFRQPVFDADGKPQYLFSVSLDITRQKRAQMQVDGERRLLETLNSSESLNDLLNAFVLSYEQAIPGMISSVLLLNADGTHLHSAASPNLPEAYCQAIESMPISAHAGSFGAAAYTGQEVLVADIATDSLCQGLRDLAAPLGLHASWSIPILSSKGQVLGTFTNYHTTTKSPTPDELQTIRRGAHMVGVAIEHRQTQAQLLAGQTSLKESALHTQTILDNMADGVITFNSRGEIESFNKAASVMFGYPAVAVIGSDISVLTPPDRRSEYLPIRKKLLHLDEEKTKSLALEFEALRRDGSLFSVSLAVSKIESAGRAIGIGILRDVTVSRRNEEEIRRLAFYDPLTELPNRRLLMDRLKQALATSARNGSHAAIMFIDLDHFKQ